MREYTTLRSGQVATILDIAPQREARAVTVCSADAAKAVAKALGCSDRKMAAALYNLATSLDGRPVDARLHLLEHFDATIVAGAGVSEPDSGWAAAEQLVEAVAHAVRKEPAAAVSAVRRELESHLEGFDGVLVPARIVAGTHKRAKLDLVISGPLSWLGDPLWRDLLDDLGVDDDDDVFPVGDVVVSATALYTVFRELENSDPIGTDFADVTALELCEMSSDDELPTLLVRPRHLAAWIQHHRPDDLGKARSALRV